MTSGLPMTQWRSELFPAFLFGFPHPNLSFLLEIFIHVANQQLLGCLNISSCPHPTLPVYMAIVSISYLDTGAEHTQALWLVTVPSL